MNAQQIEAIQKSEYLTFIKEGQFEGYHYTSQSRADLIERETFLGAPWNENLGFTSTAAANMPTDGAVFAWEKENPEMYDYDPDAICFHIKGSAYLVDHAIEGQQLIFVANTITILERK